SSRWRSPGTREAVSSARRRRPRRRSVRATSATSLRPGTSPAGSERKRCTESLRRRAIRQSTSCFSGDGARATEMRISRETSGLSWYSRLIGSGRRRSASVLLTYGPLLALSSGRPQRREILARQVLDDADLHRIIVAHQCRNAGQPRELGGAIAALAGHDHETVGRVLDDHRLQDAVLRDRGGELGERVVVEVLARL